MGCGCGGNRKKISLTPKGKMGQKKKNKNPITKPISKKFDKNK
jgi:hypothetical protein